jgi:hypothetical protein
MKVNPNHVRCRVMKSAADSKTTNTAPRSGIERISKSQLNMAGFLRGKQAGIQNDLSAGILPGLFAPDDQARFGINSQIG